MRILALETVTDAGSIALWDTGVCRGTAGDASRRHGERLPGEITRWLATAGLGVKDVDLFAVTCGPGSFTGVRVGMATIQGMALSGHKRVAGVSSLDAIVAACRQARPTPRLVAPCLDGLRGDVFYALIDTGAEPHAFENWVTILPPSAARPEAALQAIAEAAARRPVAVVGTGAERHRERFEAAGPEISVTSMAVTMAEGAAWLAAARPDRGGPPHALTAIYLRRPEAEVTRERTGASLTEPDPAWRIRRATSPADLTAVEALQAASFASPWGAEAFRWELEHTDVARLYVATDASGRILAYCACWVVMDELHINSLAVDARDRRRGAGSFLLTHVIREARHAGARSATLEVRASNRPALRLYESHGFRVEATRRDYYQDPREDALVLWRRG